MSLLKIYKNMLVGEYQMNQTDVLNELRRLADGLEDGSIKYIEPRTIMQYNSFFNHSNSAIERVFSGCYTLELEIYEDSKRIKCD